RSHKAPLYPTRRSSDLAMLMVTNTGATTFSAPLMGSGGLTVAAGSAGSLSLGADNSYGDGTTLNSGTLIVGSDGALGTGLLTLKDRQSTRLNSSHHITS